MVRKTFIILLLTAASVAATVKAQTGSGPVMCGSKTYDIREIAASLPYSPAWSGIMKATTRGGTSAPDNIRWIDRISNLPTYMRTFYDKYGTSVQEVFNGDSNYLTDYTKCPTHLTGWNDGYFITLKQWTRRIDYTFPTDVDYRNASAKEPYAVRAVEDDIEQYIEEVLTFMPILFMCMDYDNPRAFWADNYYTINWGYNYTWDIKKTPGADKVQYTFYVYYLIKDNDFDYRIDGFRSEQQIRDGLATYNAAVSNILADAPTTSRYDQIRYLNSWLTKNNAYNSDYTGNHSPLVWSPYSALTGNNGYDGPVCEGYSRAFKVLCDKLGIPCILAVGNAIGALGEEPESHMWNEVKMTDGYWYAVDVTWNDPITGNGGVDPKCSGLENERWLLLGSEDVVGFRLTFADSHPNSVLFDNNMMSYWDVDISSLITEYKYDPALDAVFNVTVAPQPVRVYSLSGTLIGTFGSTEQALESLDHGIYIINNRKVMK